MLKFPLHCGMEATSGCQSWSLYEVFILLFIVRSSQRMVALIGTDELVKVARSLLGIWKESSNNDSRTAALALLQTLV